MQTSNPNWFKPGPSHHLSELGVSIFEALAKSGWGMTAIARFMQITTSAVHRRLSLLRRAGAI
jgi:DNA-binding IclR family transcriptional regulator